MHKKLELKPNELRVGQKIDGFSCGNITQFFSAIITKVTDHTVYYDEWGTRPESIDITSDLVFIIEAPDEWYSDTYKDEISWLNNRFTNAEVYGLPKEMDNSWLDYNPYKMTAAAKEANITILGICLDPPYRKEFADMAIVFEYNDTFEKSWIHIGNEGFRLELKDLGLWDKYKWEDK